MPEAFKDELSKACSYSTSMAAGCHKETCTLHPFHLKASLCRHIEKRRTIEAQLKKTTLTAMQRDAAWDHIFGPSPAFLPSSSSSSSAAGPSISDPHLQHTTPYCDVLRRTCLEEACLEGPCLEEPCLEEPCLEEPCLEEPCPEEPCLEEALRPPPLLLGRGGGGV